MPSRSYFSWLTGRRRGTPPDPDADNAGRGASTTGSEREPLLASRGAANGQDAPRTSNGYGTHLGTSAQEQPKATPLPTLQLAILVMMRLSEPIAFTVIFPFVPQMLEDNLPGVPRSKIGYYGGVVESSFAVVQFVCSPLWATLSDSIGRKPVLLIGLCGTLVSINAYGLSKSLSGMIVARCINGAFNGNIAVLKSALAEITDETNQARAFSLIPMTFAIGSIVGPAMGGYLSEPVKSFPDLFGHSEFLAKYPYWLPCFCASVFNLVSFAIGIVFFKETLPSHLRRSEGKMVAEGNDTESGPGATHASATNTGTSTPVLSHRLSEPDLHDANTLRKHVAAKARVESTRRSNGSADAAAPSTSSSDPQNLNNDAPTASVERMNMWQIVRTPRILRVMMAQSILNLNNISYIACLPLFASEKPTLGGIGFHKQDIGHLLSMTGLLALLVQILFFPRIERRLGGPQRTLKRMFFLTPLYFIFFPLAHWAAAEAHMPKSFVWALMLVMITLKAFSSVVLVSATLCVNNVAPNRASLGAVNGAAQALASLSRAAGPPASLSLYAFSVSHQVLDGQLIWLAFIALGLLGWVLSLRVRGANRALWRRQDVPDGGDAGFSGATEAGVNGDGGASKDDGSKVKDEHSQSAAAPEYVFTTMRYDPLYEGNWHSMLPKHVRTLLPPLPPEEHARLQADPKAAEPLVAASTTSDTLPSTPSVATRIPLAPDHFARLASTVEAMHARFPHAWKLGKAGLKTSEGLPSLAPGTLERALQRGLASAGSAADDPLRVRLTVKRTGDVEATFGSMSATPLSPLPLVRLDTRPMRVAKSDVDQTPMRFKTAQRSAYEEAAKRTVARYGAASQPGEDACFDVLLWAKRGGDGTGSGGQAAVARGGRTSGTDVHASSTPSLQVLLTESSIANIVLELPQPKFRSTSSSSRASGSSQASGRGARRDGGASDAARRANQNDGRPGRGARADVTGRDRTGDDDDDGDDERRSQQTLFLTPAATLPLLPGLVRQRLLAAGVVREAEITLEALRIALGEEAARRRDDAGIAATETPGRAGGGDTTMAAPWRRRQRPEDQQHAHASPKTGAATSAAAAAAAVLPASVVVAECNLRAGRGRLWLCNALRGMWEVRLESLDLAPDALA